MPDSSYTPNSFAGINYEEYRRRRDAGEFVFSYAQRPQGLDERTERALFFSPFYFFRKRSKEN